MNPTRREFATIPGLALLLLPVSFATVASCSRPSGDLQKIEELEQRLALTEAEANSLQESNRHLLQENARLEDKLAEILPEHPPAFSESDAQNGKLILQRIFSTKTGGCFDLQRRTRCLYHEIDLDDSKGFLLYRANRMFIHEKEPPLVFDDEGRKLLVLTPDAAKRIGSWEDTDPYNPIRMTGY